MASDAQIVREVALREGFRDPLSAKVYSVYQIRNGVIFGSGKVLRTYLPVATPQVVTDYANLPEGDESQLLAVAQRWGSLGYLRVTGLDDGVDVYNLLRPGEHSADPLSWVWAHARGIRTCLKLADCIRLRDVSALEETLDSIVVERREFKQKTSDGGQQSVTQIRFAEGFGYESYVLSGISLDKTVALWSADGGTTELSEVVSAEDYARVIIRWIVNLNLSLVQPKLVVERTDDGREVFSLGNGGLLLGVVYWHLARLVAREAGYAQCEACKKFFIQKNPRQKYCPPSDYQRKKNPEARSLCEQKYNVKRWRDRKRGAVNG